MRTKGFIESPPIHINEVEKTWRKLSVSIPVHHSGGFLGANWSVQSKRALLTVRYIDIFIKYLKTFTSYVIYYVASYFEQPEISFCHLGDKCNIYNTFAVILSLN